MMSLTDILRAAMTTGNGYCHGLRCVDDRQALSGSATPRPGTVLRVNCYWATINRYHG